MPLRTLTCRQMNQSAKAEVLQKGDVRWPRLILTEKLEAGMKSENIWHGNPRQQKRVINKPVLFLIAGLGGFWATVAFYLFG
jgi:hypothetical protein